MTFELQHSDIPQPKLFDIDPVSDGPWPLPAVKPWAPASAIDQMCQEALARLEEQIQEAYEQAIMAHVIHFEVTRPLIAFAGGEMRKILESLGVTD